MIEQGPREEERRRCCTDPSSVHFQLERKHRKGATLSLSRVSLSRLSLSLPRRVGDWVWPARTGDSVNAAQSGRRALGYDARSESGEKGKTAEEGLVLSARPTSS